MFYGLDLSILYSLDLSTGELDLYHFLPPTCTERHSATSHLAFSPPTCTCTTTSALALSPPRTPKYRTPTARLFKVEDFHHPSHLICLLLHSNALRVRCVRNNSAARKEELSLNVFGLALLMLTCLYRLILLIRYLSVLSATGIVKASCMISKKYRRHQKIMYHFFGSH